MQKWYAKIIQQVVEPPSAAITELLVFYMILSVSHIIAEEFEQSLLYSVTLVH